MMVTDVWQYRCACHAKTQDCCAIDYMIHSLDHATNALQDVKNFKDRTNVGESAQSHLQSIVRRLYRIFSHAYFHHEPTFFEFEDKTHACERFTHFTKEHKMMSNDLYIIPKDYLEKRK